MFERFTDRSRRVLVLAQEEARLLGHNFLGTEHLLLGLVQEANGVAARALGELGISLERVRDAVQQRVRPGSQPTSGAPPFTPRAKKVLELALREALQLGHNYIGTEHILLGLIREGEGVAAEVLVALEADLARVRRKVVDLLSAPAGARSAGPPSGELVQRVADVATSIRSVAVDLASHLDRLSSEVRELRAEVDRLRDVLRDHGIDPGHAAAGAGERAGTPPPVGDEAPDEADAGDSGDDPEAPPSPS